jgi:hypothetical protein
MKDVAVGQERTELQHDASLSLKIEGQPLAFVVRENSTDRLPQSKSVSRTARFGLGFLLDPAMQIDGLAGQQMYSPQKWIFPLGFV